MHESGNGTSRTYRAVRYLAAFGSKADTAGDGRTMAIDAYTPWRARAKKNGAPQRPEAVALGDVGSNSRRIIHLELDRMRSVLEPDHFLHLELDVHLDEIVVEHPAGFEELAVLVEIAERLAQRPAHRGDLLELARRQVVEVLVDRRAGIELVLDAVETRHQHRRERKIRIGERIGIAYLDALALGRGGERNAAPGRAVAHRICQQHRRLEPRHQPLVGVRGRVGEGIDRARVLEDAGDVLQGGVGEIRVFVARERRLAALPDRLVAVHAGAVVAVDRFGHEGRGLAVDVGDLVDAVFVDLHLVGHAHHGGELEAQLVLGGADLVVVLLDLAAHPRHGAEHLRAHVLGGIQRRHREIAFLVPMWWPRLP